MLHLNVRIEEHIGISPFTKNKLKSKNSSVVDHLLFCKHPASYNDFNILMREKERFH